MTDLYLMCGLPAAGKTTRAMELERDVPALRLCPDEWLIAMFGPSREENDHRRDAMEALQWEVAKRAIELGVNVVLDWGLWTSGERDYYRWHAERLGARTQVVFCDAPIEELKARLRVRNDEPDTFRIEDHEMDEWVHLFQPPTARELHGWNLDRDWFHNDNAPITTLPEGSVITQDRSASTTGLYRITEQITPDDVHPDPASTMRLGQEWVIDRRVAVERVAG